MARVRPTGELLKKILRKDHILASYHRIREKYFDPELHNYRWFVPGIDGVDLRDFDRDIENHLAECREFLLEGDREFHPQILRKVPKDTPGKFREVFLLTLRDKVIQKAIADPLAEWLDRHFYPNLYSYRKGRSYGNVAAAAKVNRILKEHPSQVYAFKTDIPDYSDHMDHARLLEKFRALLPEEREVMSFLEKFASQRRMANGVLFFPIVGIPSGSSLTPLCNNLYLIDLDALMFRKGFHYLRYGDDILLLATRREDLQEGKNRIQEILAQNGLSLSDEKTVLAEPGEPFDYLGYRFGPEKVGLRSSAPRKYRDWIRSQFPRYRYRNLPNKTPAEKKERLRKILIDLNTATERGLPQLPWVRCFPIVDEDRCLRELDRFIKDRIRICVTGKVSSRNYRQVPEAWFRELGYKSLTGVYYRISRRRSLGPYQGWRRYFGTNFEVYKDEHEKKHFLVRQWRSLKFKLDFIRKALNGPVY